MSTLCISFCIKLLKNILLFRPEKKTQANLALSSRKKNRA